eukprot:6196874-Pleurochrysis_carterae.AAC.1
MEQQLVSLQQQLEREEKRDVQVARMVQRDVRAAGRDAGCMRWPGRNRMSGQLGETRREGKGSDAARRKRQHRKP